MIHDNLNKLTSINGILAAVAVPDGGTLVSSGDESLAQFARAALGLADFTKETRFRIVAGSVTVIVERHPGERIAVVVTTAHEVCKSIARTTRRLHAAKPSKTIPKPKRMSPEEREEALAEMNGRPL